MEDGDGIVESVSENTLVDNPDPRASGGFVSTALASIIYTRKLVLFYDTRINFKSF